MSLQEDLALERAALAELRDDDRIAWGQRRYSDAIRLRTEIAQAEAHICELEADVRKL